MRLRMTHRPINTLRSAPAALCLALLAVSSCSAQEPRSTAAAEAQSDPAASGSNEPAGAFGGSLDGRLIYDKACASCHANGFNGAPRLVASDWPYYQELGVDHYTYNAIQGIGIMPPRGGQPELTDRQVRQAVAYMLDQLGSP